MIELLKLRALSRVNLLTKAIADLLIVKFYYDSSLRVVEPHFLGYTKFGKKLMLVGYQISGYSKSNSMPTWRQFEVAKIYNIEVQSIQIKMDRIEPEQSDLAWGKMVAKVSK